MKSPGIQNRVPKVPADLSTLDQTLKHLRKLRWIGKEVEVQKILQVLDDTRLQPSFPGRPAQTETGATVSRETSPVRADQVARFPTIEALCPKLT
jgi:hypothetical protein